MPRDPTDELALVRQLRDEIEKERRDKGVAEDEIRLLRNELRNIELVCKYQPHSAHEIVRDVAATARAKSSWRYPIEVIPGTPPDDDEPDDDE